MDFIETDESLITVISGACGFASLITKLLDATVFTSAAGCGAATGGTIESFSGISRPSPVVTLPC